jgi:tetratricopeptide (TPR) repeat protein
LKHFQNVPIPLADDQILWNPYTLPDGQVIPKPDKPFLDRARNRQTFLIPIASEGKTVKVATMMLDEIVLTNKWKYPIYFASPAGEVQNSGLRLVERCYRDGLVMRLSTDSAKMAFDEAVTDSLFYRVYKYRNLDDTLVSQDENTTGIALGYPEQMFDYCSYLMRRGQTDHADSVLALAARIIPSYWTIRLTEREMYLSRGDSVKAGEVERDLLANLHAFQRRNPGNIFFNQFLGLVYYTLDDKTRAEEYLTRAWEMNHDKDKTFRALLALYTEQRRGTDMLRIAGEYKEYHENDKIANEVLRSAGTLRQPAPPPPTVPQSSSGGQ